MPSHGLGLVLCVLLLAQAPPAAADPQTPFVAALAGVWDGPGNPVIPEVLVSDPIGPVLVETGALPTAWGRSRSAYGSNGFEIQVTGGIDREVDVGSIWTDAFTVTGGAGSGTLALSTHIVGSVSGHAEMFQAVFVSAQPFDLQTIRDTVGAAPGFWAVQLPNAARVFFTGIANRCNQPSGSNDCGHVPYENYQGDFDLTMSTGVPFTYGQSLYVVSLFGGGVGIFGGSSTFFNSATFGITGPAGSTLASMTGTAYAAAAVPEPAAWLLLALGLVAGSLIRRRRPPGSPRPAR